MSNKKIMAVVLATAIGWFYVGYQIGSSIEWNIQQKEELTCTSYN